MSNLWPVSTDISVSKIFETSQDTSLLLADKSSDVFIMFFINGSFIS